MSSMQRVIKGNFIGIHEIEKGIYYCRYIKLLKYNLWGRVQTDSEYKQLRYCLKQYKTKIIKCITQARMKSKIQQKLSW